MGVFPGVSGVRIIFLKRGQWVKVLLDGNWRAEESRYRLNDAGDVKEA